MIHFATTSTADFECVAIRRGRDVVLMVAEHLLTPRGAIALTATIAALSRDAADLLDKIG